MQPISCTLTASHISDPFIFLAWELGGWVYVIPHRRHRLVTCTHTHTHTHTHTGLAASASAKGKFSDVPAVERSPPHIWLLPPTPEQAASCALPAPLPLPCPIFPTKDLADPLPEVLFEALLGHLPNGLQRVTIFKTHPSQIELPLFIFLPRR